MWIALLVCAWFRVTSSADQVAPWWGKAVYYRIRVDSFKDGDGDGLGDIAGATKQLSYVRALGADAVILSPVAARSADCSWPGVTDHAALDQRYGSMQDFTEFIEKANKLELKVVVTLPLQRVSASSDWFMKSASKDDGYDDWILWRSGESADVPPEPEPGVQEWHWNAKRSAFSASSNNESLLNLCSEGVQAALSSAQCAWIRRGVSGVMLQPDQRANQSCAERLVKKLAADAMSCARASSFESPAILVESSLPPELSSRYLSDGGVGANSVVSTALTSSERKPAAAVTMDILTTMTYTPEDSVPTWTTSTSNDPHVSSRFGNELIDAVNLLTLTLPGAAIIQQGDELGIADAILEWTSTKDTCWPYRHTASAVPFAWDTTTNGGFTVGEPWLPAAPNYRYANAKTQFNNEGSHAGVVRVAAAMRKSPAIGPNAEVRRIGGAIAVLRWGNIGSLLAVCNMGRDQTEIQLSKIPGLPAEMTVATSSAGSSLTPGSHVNVEKTLKLGAGESILLAGPPRHCGGPGPIDKITTKLQEGWQKLNKYFNN